MYILYNCNIETRDSAVLAETLRGLALAGMALARLLQVHNHIRIPSNSSDSSFSDFLADMGAAASRANKIASSISGPDEDDLDD